MKSSKPHFDNLREQTLSTRLIYAGKSFSFHTDEVVFPDGRQGRRDYVRYPEAVVILPLKGERVVFTRQYRYAPGKELLEIPAGKVDEGEAPLEAVRRELREETGYDSEHIEYMFSYYPCPGYSTEKIHIYVARDLFEAPLEADEDEFILTEVLSIDEVHRAIREGRIEDGKTILAILAYETGLKREVSR